MPSPNTAPPRGTRWAAWGYRLGYRASRALPLAGALAVAERTADGCWRRATPERTAVARNLSGVTGRRIDEQDDMVRETFRNFSRYLTEVFLMDRLSMPILRMDGFAHLERARRQGRGAIVLTGHLGNWELGASLLSRLGVPMAAVALPHADPNLDRLFTRQRGAGGVTTIPLGEHAARQGLEALRQGGCLGLVGDRPFDDHTVPVSLCGQPVRLPRGPALLSLRSRAPIVPTTLLREGRWAFRLCMEPAIAPVVCGTLEESIRMLSQRCAAALERQLGRAPEQWLLFTPVFPDRA